MRLEYYDMESSSRTPEYQTRPEIIFDKHDLRVYLFFQYDFKIPFHYNISIRPLSLQQLNII